MLLPDRYKGHVFGLPEDAIAWTNSERSDLGCARKWWFKHVEGLTPKKTSLPLRFGDAFHGVVEDIFRWWMVHDRDYPMSGLDECVWCVAGESCTYCAGTRIGPLRRYEMRWTKEAAHSRDPGPATAEAAEESTRLRRCVEGYLWKYGVAPFADYKIVGVELSIARQIVHPRTRRPFRPTIDLVYNDASGAYRMASSGESSGARPIPKGFTLVPCKKPWYQVGRLDALAIHRRTGVIYVIEHKTSKAPRRLIEGILVDPQTAGYCWLVEGARGELFTAGILPAPDLRVAGYIYDVASSTPHRDPELLKPKKDAPPALSRATNRVTPSWRYMAALARQGLNPADYGEHLALLRDKVDPKLYVRDWGTIGDERREEYGFEAWGVSARLAGLRRAAGLAEDVIDIEMAFPRTAICRAAGGHCPYRGPCVMDTPEAREDYDVQLGASSVKDAVDEEDEENNDLGW